MEAVEADESQAARLAAPCVEACAKAAAPRCGLASRMPQLVVLEVHTFTSGCAAGTTAPTGDALERGRCTELVPLTWMVAARVPYVVSAVAAEWRRRPPGDSTDQDCRLRAGVDNSKSSSSSAPIEGAKTTELDIEAAAVVQVYLPTGCSCAVLRALMSRMAVDCGSAIEAWGCGRAMSSSATGCSGPVFTPLWRPTDLIAALQLVQVASMLQIEELLPELVSLVKDAVSTPADVETLEAACGQLELPAALQEAAAIARNHALEPSCLPDEAQVRGMIASALLTADGKVWRVVQKVIDGREAWPRTAKENAAILLAFATGAHSSIRATPHTGFFWGSRDFLYLVCRYVRYRPEHLDGMVTAMFDSVYNMDPELPAEIIDAVFKELLSCEGLSFAQCEHVIAKLMQREDQLSYLFHEWSGVFPSLPPNARRALAKGLLPAVGRCPHAALDFVLKELEAAPLQEGRGRGARRSWAAIVMPFAWLTPVGNSTASSAPSGSSCQRNTSARVGGFLTSGGARWWQGCRRRHQDVGASSVGNRAEESIRRRGW